MYSVSPKDFERYCLCLLLLHIAGTTCFKDHHTVENHTGDTFKGACILLHLLTDDTEWDSAMEEALTFKMPVQLRSLFATICLHCRTDETVVRP